MKTGISFLIYSLFSGSGFLSGNFLFEEVFSSSKTISQKLIEKGISVLDTEGIEDDDAWLVLAQKYRENGTVKVGEERNFKNQEDPKFLNTNYWDRNIKNKESTEAGKHIFSKDSQIANYLKQTCKESLIKPATEELISKVEKWCVLYLSDDLKGILKFQRDNGGCRFWMIGSVNNKSGWFVWEDLGKNKSLINRLYGSLLFSKYTGDQFPEVKKKSLEVLDECKNKKDQIVELVYLHNGESSKKYSWQLYSKWDQKQDSYWDKHILFEQSRK